MQTDETRAREVLAAIIDETAAFSGARVRSGDLSFPVAAGDAIRAMLAFASAPPDVEREDDEPLFERIRETFRPVDYQLSCEVIDAIRRLTRLSRQADREAIARIREAVKSVIDNAVSSYRSRGKDRYIEDESGERMMLVPHEDWALLQGALSPTPSAGRDDAGHPLARMVALDEEIEAEHPGWMTGQNTLPPATEKAEK